MLSENLLLAVIARIALVVGVGIDRVVTFPVPRKDLGRGGPQHGL